MWTHPALLRLLVATMPMPNPSNFTGGECQPQFPASALQMSLSGSVTPVWLYEKSHAEVNNLPDFHPVAYRTADGSVHLSISHFENYRISGATLDSLSTTQKTFDSDGPLHSAAWGDFGHHQWVASPFTNDGKTFYALAHSEWYACLQYGDDPVKGCTVGNNQVNSWVNGITLFASHDGGATWSPAGENNEAHVVAAPSMEYPADWQYWTFGDKLRNYGFFHPSNIVEQNSFYYATAGYVHRTASNVVDSIGAILIRTSSLTNAKGWTVWDGTSYVPLPASWDDLVPVLKGVDGGDGLMSTITWSASVCQYIILFTGSTGAKFVTTPSLESPQLTELKTVGGGEQLVAQNYPIIQDDAYPSWNFHTLLGDSAYMYTVRQNGGMNRDVVKQKITLSAGPAPAPGPSPPPPVPSPPPGPPPPVSVHAMYRCVLPSGAHLTTTRSDCDGSTGAKMDTTLGFVSSSSAAGTHALYRCHNGGDHFISLDAGCEGMASDGILGYIWNSASTLANVAIYRCILTDGLHMTSVSSTCEGAGSSEGVMGYARSAALRY